MRLKPSIEDTAAFFDCTKKTIMRFMKSEFNTTFKEFREKHMVHTRYDIVRTAIEKALKGDNVMLIFCLKNLCGWKDRFEEDVKHTFKPSIVVRADGSEVVYSQSPLKDKE